jgi:glucoamylase
MAAGKTLRVETFAPGIVHWGHAGAGENAGWKQIHDSATVDTGIGVYVADLPTTELLPGSRVDFTFYWPGAARWEGSDFHVLLMIAQV